MDRYLIVLPHTLEDCKKAIKQVEAIGAITHFDWGCMDGDHTGYVCIEADSKEQAIMVVPTIERKLARVIKLNKFTPDDVRKMHSA